MKNERILLSLSMWWVGKKEGKLLVTMFGVRMPSGEIAMAWDVLDESNLPVDLIRRDGEEYSFILPVGLQRNSIEKVGEGGRLDTPVTAADVGAGLSGALADIDAVLPTGSVGNNDVTDGRPVKGVSNHDDGVLNSSTNAIEHATLSAGASVDHGVDVEVTKGHVNRAADRGCCVSACSASYS